ncbi:GGDEF domain-containing protein [Paenibacillus antri]|uniref:GGDEF domain-containing protein n=1 Tax=Paenibacillus antri TaxID=2582848 RepID=A0A5R9GP30_9BACL|nr:GGDEF domain-containing protein [Paenibacillus antri]TLS53955.1 GGDEF domain-containing protein [Paenibacillus antri]
MASELFFGSSGGIVSALMILLMLFLMTAMSLRLMLSRKKKAYFSLTFSLLLIAVQYAAVVAIGARPDAGDGGAYLVNGLQTLSFIALNVGLYQLYNPTKRKVTFLAYLGTILTLLILGARYYAASELFPDPAAAASVQANAFLNVWMDIYLYALIFFCFYFVTPSVGQTAKYQTALVVYFLTHSAAVLNSYIYDEGATGLRFAEHFLPVVFFFIVFLFIFERVLELMQAVYHSSITDGLTGLYNRRFFMRRLQQYLQGGVAVGVIFTDIDNFKKLNDTKGHQQGDEALRKVASIVLEIAEDIGLGGRYGGEEIVMIVADPKLDPGKVAERLRARVEAEAGVTVSVGWAKYRKGVTAEQLTKQADEAMYVSKKTGKNRVTAYKPGMTAAGLPPLSGPPRASQSLPIE